MEQTLNPHSERLVRVAFARVLQLVGWAGLAGCLLLVVAAYLAADAWSTHRRLAREALADRAAPVDRTSVAAPTPQASVLKLPSADDIPLLLNRIERAAVGNGLPWAAGDYRLVAATTQSPATIEVRCALKGPYPKLRAMVADLLGIAPAVTFKEMSFSRQVVTAGEVDAQFVVVVFLADEKSMHAAAAERSSR